ncbi:20165_t:CDS:2, partial [Dentiscutata erythropus]
PLYKGNKEELNKKLYTYYDKRSNRGQELGPRNADDRTGEVVDMNLDEDRGGEFEDNLDEDSQKADNRIREKFAVCFREKEKVKSVSANIGRYLDKAIRLLPESNRKEFVGVHEEVESRAITLRLADNRG